jgi:eukaryotic-like serine/threonine-protein kinase
LHTALAALESAPSLRASASPAVDALATIDAALATLSQIFTGSRSGFGVRIRIQRTLGSLAYMIASVLEGRTATIGEAQLSLFADAVGDRVPAAIASIISGVVFRLGELPLEAGGRAQTIVTSASLPPWIPPRRTLGGFYVVRSLGSGAAGTVFLANRLEERSDPDAEKVALKVPDYSASASRSLTEAQFMQLFREEAAALIGLPSHPNLARFVTFDLGAKPKPILAMEFVEGITLEREISARTMTMPRALKVLADLLSGIEAMHGAGIAHLDVKPSNVVLRGGKDAVLVDFGLAGRKIRPGCATGSYGAPEVWAASENTTQSPMPADVYAFACVAFELLTAVTLFDGPSEIALISMHLAHDGSPAGVKKLAVALGGDALAEVLFSALRRDPAKRASIRDLKRDFDQLSKKLSTAKWPLTL